MEYLVIWGIMGLIGALIAGSKGHSRFGGFLFGILLGPIGWLIVGLMKSAGKDCPNCGQRVPKQANACFRCGYDFVNRRVPTATPSPIPAVAASAAPQSTGGLKTCPRCAESVQPAALVCRYCGHEFSG